MVLDSSVGLTQGFWFLRLNQASVIKSKTFLVHYED
jgi:hypothetical protein